MHNEPEVKKTYFLWSKNFKKKEEVLKVLDRIFFDDDDIEFFNSQLVWRYLINLYMQSMWFGDEVEISREAFLRRKGEKTFKNDEDQKEEEARKQGEKYIQEEWYGSQPVDIPLPESYKEFNPLLDTEKKQKKKQIVITDSDDLDPNNLEEYFKSNQSGREKKRQNAPGSIDSGEDE